MVKNELIPVDWEEVSLILAKVSYTQVNFFIEIGLLLIIPGLGMQLRCQ